ncbi:hypothetical protein [Couchioplanes azureus]|uniref:hypothetical protein n=1 Tax=Couchioplanes caeruleus TaxID=56438 RepID=UPI001671183B|nr:hypothetical protein [Couchioplanes caeruleus]GGQ59884.1 hypothetical protein GCM10010166_31860 [Couchioplanes caeruleus subsp. azureus]
MSRDSGSRTVTTRFVWLPHGSAAGWLLLHRTVTDPATGLGTDEFWRSERISPEAVASGAFQDSAPEWHRIVTGGPVPFLLWPFFLAAVTDRELPAVREQLLRSPIRPIADIGAEVDGSAGSPAVAAPRVVLAGDPFGPAPGDLDLGDGWDVARLDREGRREALLTAVRGRIRHAGVPAPRKGDRQVWINRFLARPGPPPRSALAEVLAREPVRRAVAGLLAAPQDEAGRRTVAAELREHGWSMVAQPLRLRGDEPALGFLGRLVLFCGEEGAAHHVATLPACAETLRRHAGLTAALARHLCPLDPAPGDAGPARDRLREALRALPPEWAESYPGAPGLAPPAWDEVTTLTHDEAAPAGGGLPRRPVEISHVELVDSNGRHSWRIDLSVPTGPRTDADR